MKCRTLGTTQLELHWTELVRRYKLGAKGPSIDSVLSDYTSLRWKQLTMKFEAAVTTAKETELAEVQQNNKIYKSYHNCRPLSHHNGPTHRLIRL